MHHITMRTILVAFLLSVSRPFMVSGGPIETHTVASSSSSTKASSLVIEHTNYVSVGTEHHTKYVSFASAGASNSSDTKTSSSSTTKKRTSSKSTTSTKTSAISTTNAKAKPKSTTGAKAASIPVTQNSMTSDFVTSLSGYFQSTNWALYPTANSATSNTTTSRKASSSPTAHTEAVSNSKTTAKKTSSSTTSHKANAGFTTTLKHTTTSRSTRNDTQTPKSKSSSWFISTVSTTSLASIAYSTSKANSSSTARSKSNSTMTAKPTHFSSLTTSLASTGSASPKKNSTSGHTIHGTKSSKSTNSSSLVTSFTSTTTSSLESQPSSTTSPTNSSNSTTDSSGSQTSNPPWNLTDTSCGWVTGLNASQQWAAIDGDSMVETYNQMFSGNKLICKECLGMDKDACKSTDPHCANGLRDLALMGSPGSPSPRWDTGAGQFAQNSGLQDLNCALGSTECSGAPQCGDCNGPGSWLLLKSLETLHNTLQNVHDAIQDAGQAATNQMQQFQQNFAPVPSIKDEAIMLGILIAIVGGMFGFLTGPEGAIAGILIGIGSTIGMEMFFFSQPPPPDTSSVLGVIVNATKLTYTNLANALFTDGSYTFTTADGKASSTVTLQNLMKDGALLEASGTLNSTEDALVPTYERIMYQQLAVYTWQNLEVGSIQHVPYIVFDNMPCDQVNPNAKGGMSSVIAGVGSIDTNITYAGKCYYLLDAFPADVPIGVSTPAGTPVQVLQCTGGNALPGGTNKNLNNNAGIFAGLSLADFIIPSVRGWIQYHNQNGYPSASANGQLVSDPQDAGAVSIPICDYVGNPNSPGVNCPILDGKMISGSICNQMSSASGTNQPGAYNDGTCSVHIDQYQMHEGDENPLGNYQLSAVITDQKGIQIGSATKQSAADVLNIIDSVLPYDLFVATIGGDDSNPVQFWYSDQFWDSSSTNGPNKCSVGLYDSGMRQMDCSFNCPVPSGDTPPVSATVSHPFPNAPTNAIGGATSYVNTFQSSATPTPTSTGPPPPPPTPTYATGQCGLHIRQYQKNEGPNINPTGDYQIEATLFAAKDAKGNQAILGITGKVPAKLNVPVVMTGLVSPLTITAGPVDSSPFIVNYAVSGQWNTTQGWHCNNGGFDSGSQGIDCLFAC